MPSSPVGAAGHLSQSRMDAVSEFPGPIQGTKEAEPAWVPPPARKRDLLSVGCLDQGDRQLLGSRLLTDREFHGLGQDIRVAE